MTELPMNDPKLDQALTVLARLEARLEIDFGEVKKSVARLEQDLGAVKQDLGAVKQDLGAVKHKQDEMIAAFRAHWADMSSLHRAMRKDLELFEERFEGKLSQVNQSIVALRDSLERRDFRSDELGRRVSRLELGDKPPY